MFVFCCLAFKVSRQDLGSFAGNSVKLANSSFVRSKSLSREGSIISKRVSLFVAEECKFTDEITVKPNGCDSGFEVTGGNYSSRVDINSAALAIFSECRFETKSSVNGGAIGVTSCTNFTITSCNFVNCETTAKGGAIHTSGSKLEIYNSYYYNCIADDGRYIMSDHTNFVFHTITFEDEPSFTGAFSFSFTGISGELFFYSITFIYINSQKSNIGIWTSGSETLHKYENCTFYKTHGPNGGAIGEYNFGNGDRTSNPDTHIIDCKFIQCYATAESQCCGAINIDIPKGISIQISGCTFDECSSSDVRCIRLIEQRNNIQLTNLTFMNMKSVGHLIWFDPIPQDILSRFTFQNISFNDLSNAIVGIGRPKAFDFQFCNFIDISSTRSNGAAFSLSAGTFRNCRFEKLSVSGQGGALHINGAGDSVLVSSCDFVECQATGDGGAIKITDTATASITVSHCNFDRCESSGNGGAIHAQKPFVAEFLVFTDCKANQGACMHLNDATNAASECRMSNCSFIRGIGRAGSGNSGGAFIHTYSLPTSKLIMEGCTIDSCSSSNNLEGDWFHANAVNVEFTDCHFMNHNGKNPMIFGGIGNSNLTPLLMTRVIFENIVAQNMGSDTFSMGIRMWPGFAQNSLLNYQFCTFKKTNHYNAIICTCDRRWKYQFDYCTFEDGSGSDYYFKATGSGHLEIKHSTFIDHFTNKMTYYSDSNDASIVFSHNTLVGFNGLGASKELMSFWKINGMNSLTGCKFINCASNGNRGASGIYIFDTEITYRECEFINCTTLENGVFHPQSASIFENCLFEGNKGKVGALCLSHDTVIRGCRFIKNEGEIVNKISGSITVSIDGDESFSSNVASAGGVFDGSLVRLTVTSSLLTCDELNMVTSGFFHLSGGSVELSQVTIESPISDSYFIEQTAGSLSITDSRFENTSSSIVKSTGLTAASITRGSFLTNDESPVIVSCETLTVEGSTFTNNRATSANKASAIEASVSSTATITGTKFTSIKSGDDEIQIFLGGSGSVSIGGSCFTTNRNEFRGVNHIKSDLGGTVTLGVGNCFSSKKADSISVSSSLIEETIEMYECVDCVYHRTPQFSLSKTFKETMDFSITSEFKPTQDFSTTSIFAKTNEYSVSSNFKQSTDFSVSSCFEETKAFPVTSDFDKTYAFSTTTNFIYTKDFSTSESFVDSKIFSITSNFGESAKFSISNEFLVTSDFIESKEFSLTSRFKFTSQFIESEDFSLTSDFSTTNEFKESNGFSLSIGPTNQINEESSTNGEIDSSNDIKHQELSSEQITENIFLSSIITGETSYSRAKSDNYISSEPTTLFGTQSSGEMSNKDDSQIYELSSELNNRNEHTSTNINQDNDLLSSSQLDTRSMEESTQTMEGNGRYSEYESIEIEQSPSTTSTYKLTASSEPSTYKLTASSEPSTYKLTASSESSTYKLTASSESSTYRLTASSESSTYKLTASSESSTVINAHTSEIIFSSNMIEESHQESRKTVIETFDSKTSITKSAPFDSSIKASDEISSVKDYNGDTSQVPTKFSTFSNIVDDNEDQVRETTTNILKPTNEATIQSSIASQEASHLYKTSDADLKQTDFTSEKPTTNSVKNQESSINGGFNSNTKESVNEKETTAYEEINTNIELSVVESKSPVESTFDENSESKSKAGMIAGIVVGLIVAISIIIVLVVYFILVKNKTYSDSSSFDNIDFADETETSGGMSMSIYPEDPIQTNTDEMFTEVDYEENLLIQMNE